MLNKCTEKGQAKCWQYWPEEGSPPMTYNEFVVENLGCEDEGVYRLNRIKLENTQVRGGQLVFLWEGGGGVEGGSWYSLLGVGIGVSICWNT